MKKNLGHACSVSSVFLPFCQRVLSKSLLSLLLQEPTTPSKASTISLNYICGYVTKENGIFFHVLYVIFMPQCRI